MMCNLGQDQVCCWQVLEVLNQAVECAKAAPATAEASDSQCDSLRQALCTHFRRAPLLDQLNVHDGLLQAPLRFLA